LAILLFSLLGCDDSVNPYAPFQPRMTVYALLNTSSNVQIIRVYSSFDPSVDPAGGSAPDTLLNDANITLSDQLNSYSLRDTILYRADTTQYKGDIDAKVVSLVPVFGRTYTLTVQSPTKGTVTARATIPAQGTVSINGLFVLSDPLRYDATSLGMNIKTNSRGYILRMLLEYEVYINGIWFPKQDEVPHNVQTGADSTLPPQYAQLELSKENFSFLWPLNTLSYTLRMAIYRYNKYRITFKRVIIELRQYEEHLYDYYQVVRGFRDPRTIRTDTPDYTNLQGGLGIFGAFTVERTIFDLPPNYIKNQ